MTRSIFFYQKLHKGCSISCVKFQHDRPHSSGCIAEKPQGGRIDPPASARINRYCFSSIGASILATCALTGRKYGKSNCIINEWRSSRPLYNNKSNNKFVSLFAFTVQTRIISYFNKRPYCFQRQSLSHI